MLFSSNIFGIFYIVLCTVMDMLPERQSDLSKGVKFQSRRQYTFSHQWLVFA